MQLPCDWCPQPTSGCVLSGFTSVCSCTLLLHPDEGGRPAMHSGPPPPVRPAVRGDMGAPSATPRVGRTCSTARSLPPARPFSLSLRPPFFHSSHACPLPPSHCIHKTSCIRRIQAGRMQLYCRGPPQPNAVGSCYHRTAASREPNPGQDVPQQKKKKKKLWTSEYLGVKKRPSRPPDDSGWLVTYGGRMVNRSRLAVNQRNLAVNRQRLAANRQQLASNCRQLACNRPPGGVYVP